MRHAFDLHLHTHYSADACGSPEAMVAAAKHKGLSGIALTDHNTCDAVEYLTRKGMIREDGLPVDGFLIVPGVEVSTADGHLLCLGTTLPVMKGRPSSDVVTAIRKREESPWPLIPSTDSVPVSGRRCSMISIWQPSRSSTPPSASSASMSKPPPMRSAEGSPPRPEAMPTMIRRQASLDGL